MMRVCVVTYDEYVNIPYVKIYERVLKKKGMSFDIILWNRSGYSYELSDLAENSYLFQCETGMSKFTKVIPFLRWRRFAKRILNNGCYSGIIVCTTIPAVLLSDVLLRYPKRFLLDIRDYTLEHYCAYRLIEKGLLRIAGLAVISSSGFLKWLPKRNIPVVPIHNIDNIESIENEPDANILIKSQWTIGFVGGVRYFDINKKLIAQFANNSQFTLIYVGKQHKGCDLQEFCKQNGYNVIFKPRYANEEKPLIYQEIDFINCVYGADSPETLWALPNRLYDCALFKKPIIVSKGTYLQTIVEKYKLGIAVDLSKEIISTQLCEYIHNFDSDTFRDGCREYLSVVMQEHAAAIDKIESFIQRIKQRNADGKD